MDVGSAPRSVVTDAGEGHEDEGAVVFLQGNAEVERDDAVGPFDRPRADGVLELDLRLTLDTDDGALIYMTSFGLVTDHRR